MTFHEAIFNICQKHIWPAKWFRLERIIVSTGKDRSWQAKSYLDSCPSNVEALGCSGISGGGMLDWVGWDFDVGHGATAYDSTAAALVDARRLRDALHGHAEIRYSRSGSGLHVYHLLPPSTWLKLPATAGPTFAKRLAADLKLRCDPAPLGRQCFWLWERTPKNPNSFKLVEASVDD